MTGNQRYCGAIDRDGLPSTESASVQDFDALVMLDHAPSVAAQARARLVGNAIEMDYSKVDNVEREFAVFSMSTTPSSPGQESRVPSDRPQSRAPKGKTQSRAPNE